MSLSSFQIEDVPFWYSKAFCSRLSPQDNATATAVDSERDVSFGCFDASWFFTCSLNSRKVTEAEKGQQNVRTCQIMVFFRLQVSGFGACHDHSTTGVARKRYLVEIHLRLLILDKRL